MVTSVNNALLNYLTSSTQDGSQAGSLALARAKAAAASTAGSASTSKSTSSTSTPSVPKAALDRAAGTAKLHAEGQRLEQGAQKLATELRAALNKAGVKLSGALEFAVKSDGTVETKGSDADKAAIKAFLSADTRQPSFASRMATQAKDALKLSATIQQSAAISQAAKVAGTSGNVMSLYSSFMQQSSTTTVVFSVSASAASLTYPGSLRTNA